MSIRSRLKIRTRLRSLVRRLLPKRPLILMYHRVADEPVDCFCLSVSPGCFEQQLEVLRRTRYPLSLSDFVRNLRAGTLRRDAVALTFDDGYVDNLDAGKPRLAAADVPATVFLVTGYLNRPGPIWWDELARLILVESGPPSFELSVRGEPFVFKPADSLTRRRAVLETLRNTLRVLDEEEREAVMVKLRAIFGARDFRATLGRAMTDQEVHTLVADGLVTIGAHTVTHPVLPALESAACRREVVESKAACEALIGAPVAGFTYPYGDFDSRVSAAVRDAGFAFSCSVQSGPADAASDIFALPRLHVRNWGGDAFEEALRGG